MKDKNRKQTLGEEIGNAVSHGCGFLGFLIGSLLLLIKAEGVLEYIGVSLFCFGLLSLYIMSCLYHSFKNDSMVKKVFRVFDHSSIYLLIAGTYSPMWLIVVGGTFGLVCFIIQWALVVLGIVFKILFLNKGKILSVIIYLAMGWCGLIVLPKIYEYNPLLLLFIFLGGVSYSVGICFYAARFKYAHFIWHFFVLVGSILHFLGIYFLVL